MANAETDIRGGFWSAFFPSPEERAEIRKQKARARRKQRETDLKVAQDLRDCGYFDQNQDPFFHRPYYF